MRFDLACNICRSQRFQEFAVRADGIPVIICSVCGHGVVQHFTEDVKDLYGDDYFSSAKASGIGYEDYAYTAEHSVAWAAALVELLRPNGRILDVGCANGHLLRKLGPAYERFGIEPNARASEECHLAGISILASELPDDDLGRNYAQTFDLALAIAVFEHIPHFREAIEGAIDLLRPDGLLLFEVPLISEANPSDLWMSTSLEHIHYPTERSLEYLFHDVLGLRLAGAPLPIRNFTHTYVGMTSKSEAVLESARQRFNRWRSAPAGSLNPMEARFRCLFDLIHAAKADPDVLALCRYLLPSDVNHLIVRRFADLWITEVKRWQDTEIRCKKTQDYLRAVEEARDWHAHESNKRDRIIAMGAQELDARARRIQELTRELDAKAQMIQELTQNR
jgi:SAM-dependent methyltransferase